MMGTPAVKGSSPSPLPPAPPLPPTTTPLPPKLPFPPLPERVPRPSLASSAGTGETAREYLRRRRLERAQHLLLGPGSELAVAAVATRSGFDSPSSFTRAYRSRFGVAPREGRRRFAAT